MSGELIAASATGSAARAQHPHVTQAGGQLLSLLPAGSLAVQGSALTRLTTPEALNVSNATMMARANRCTTLILAFGRVPARGASWRRVFRTKRGPGSVERRLPVAGVHSGHNDFPLAASRLPWPAQIAVKFPESELVFWFTRGTVVSALNLPAILLPRACCRRWHVLALKPQ